MTDDYARDVLDAVARTPWIGMGGMRAIAAALDFNAAMKRLETSPGYTTERVEELKRGILDLASITGDVLGSETSPRVEE